MPSINTSTTPAAALVGMLLIGSIFACGHRPPDNNTIQSVWLKPTTYNVAGTLLSSPVRIVIADYFSDGGSMMLKFRDVNGRELIVVHYTPLVAGTAAEQRKHGEPYHFYAGGFPKDRGAVQLKPGGEDELEIKRLLGDCVTWAQASNVRIVEPDEGSDSYGSRWDGYHDKNVRYFGVRLDHEIKAGDTKRTASNGSRPN